MEPHWLAVLSWAALGVAFASALAITLDELRPGRGPHSAVMYLVHPITALYLGPIWLWAYARTRRQRGKGDSPGVRARQVADAVSHCGAGCTLGDIGGEWILFAVFSSPTLGALGTYGWEIVADFALAWTFGVVFQYFTIVPMRPETGKLEGLLAAVKVDTLSIVAFQIGLFGWMALAHFVLFDPPLRTDTSGHWFMMQIGMIAGYGTAWPANRWLIRRGIKETMDHEQHDAPGERLAA
jgi:uncharacterized protein DUF4396